MRIHCRKLETRRCPTAGRSKNCIQSRRLVSFPCPCQTLTLFLALAAAFVEVHLSATLFFLEDLKVGSWISSTLPERSRPARSCRHVCQSVGKFSLARHQACNLSFITLTWMPVLLSEKFFLTRLRNPTLEKQLNRDSLHRHQWIKPSISWRTWLSEQSELTPLTRESLSALGIRRAHSFAHFDRLTVRAT